MIKKDKRPIYFHHFHKCAGSSFISNLKKTRNFYEPNINGNPSYSDKKQLDLHADFNNRTELEKILEKKNSFAYEWGIPNLDLLPENYIKIVVIREPKERLLSNYFFDLNSKNFNGNLLTYCNNLSIPFMRGDFYTYEIQRYCIYKQIKNKYNGSDQAKVLTNLFDVIIIFEKKDFKIIKGKILMEEEKIEIPNFILNKRNKVSYIKQFVLGHLNFKAINRSISDQANEFVKIDKIFFEVLRNYNENF